MPPRAKHSVATSLNGTLQKVCAQQELNTAPTEETDIPPVERGPGAPGVFQVPGQLPGHLRPAVANQRPLSHWGGGNGEGTRGLMLGKHWFHPDSSWKMLRQMPFLPEA